MIVSHLEAPAGSAERWWSLGITPLSSAVPDYEWESEVRVANPSLIFYQNIILRPKEYITYGSTQVAPRVARCIERVISVPETLGNTAIRLQVTRSHA